MMIVSGTLYNSMKLTEMNNRWKQKKESGEALSKCEINRRAEWTAEERMKHDYQQQLLRDEESAKNNAIHNKIASGGILTPEEERYLEKKDPTALQRYRQTKLEKQTYKKKLEGCETKEEVEQLKADTVAGYMSSFKKIEDNPYIPISAKLAEAQTMLAKSRNIEEVENEFKQSGEYSSLPTEAEKRLTEGGETIFGYIEKEQHAEECIEKEQKDTVRLLDDNKILDEEITGIKE